MPERGFNALAGHQLSASPFYEVRKLCFSNVLYGSRQKL